MLLHFFLKVEDTFQKGQEKDKEDPDSKPDTKGEDNAIEMSEDFDGKMYDGELEEGLRCVISFCVLNTKYFLLYSFVTSWLLTVTACAMTVSREGIHRFGGSPLSHTLILLDEVTQWSAEKSKRTR